ncbi:MAG: hypothetical protein K6T85_01800 [Gorillibacterium sp.]|nr:hypothetical protein [Gorillibacterium sp.]
MVYKGFISSIDLNRKRARVTFPDQDNAVTGELPYAVHVLPQINDLAAVILFSPVMSDGLIIAVYREGN